VSMAVKLMMFYGAFNVDGASASSSPVWMIGVNRQHSWGFEDGLCP
jgi:hypothetical protein